MSEEYPYRDSLEIWFTVEVQDAIYSLIWDLGVICSA